MFFLKRGPGHIHEGLAGELNGSSHHDPKRAVEEKVEGPRGRGRGPAERVRRVHGLPRRTGAGMGPGAGAPRSPLGADSWVHVMGAH